MSEDNSNKLSKEEAAVYDRQIRLWGLEAQKRIRTSRVLLYGLDGVGTEIAKNVILAGVKSVHLVDDALVSEDDECNYFVSGESHGQNRAVASREKAAQLNPLVHVTASAIDSESDLTETTLANYDYVVCVSRSYRTIAALNRRCRAAGDHIRFFACDSFGLFGFAFADLRTHRFADEQNAPRAEDDADSTNKRRKLEDGSASANSSAIESAENEPAGSKDSFLKSSEYESFEEALDRHAKLAVTTRAKRRRGRNANNAAIVGSRIDMLSFLVTILKFADSHDASEKSNTSSQPVAEQVAALFSSVAETLCGGSSSSSSTSLDADADLQRAIAASTVCEAGGKIAELAPICAILGGLVAQEIVKSIAARNEPMRNLFLFNGLVNEGVIHAVGV